MSVAVMEVVGLVGSLIVVKMVGMAQREVVVIIGFNIRSVMLRRLSS